VIAIWRTAPRARSVNANRLIDIAVAGAFLLVLMPLLLVIAAAIRIDSRGPIFFRCRRVGFRGAELQMLAAQVSEKIERVHGGMGELAPLHWTPATTCRHAFQ